MTERNIAIGIDSTKAEAGGRVVKRSLDEVGNAAVNMEKKVDSANASITRMSSSANDNLRRVSQNAQAAGGNLGRLQSIMSGLGNVVTVTIAGLVTLGGILATIAAANILGGFVKLSDAFKSMTSQLRLVTASTGELIAVQEALFQVAQRTRSSYESTTTLYARLARSASSLGLAQKDLLQITENINKTFIISGASAEESANAIRQLAQGLASGALRGDEFNAVAESAPRLMQILAESLGMTTGQLRAFAGEGKITADIITKALLGATAKLNDEFNKMGVTIGQSMTVLGNSVLRAVGQLDAALGISDAIAKGIIAIANAIDNLSSTIASAAPYLTILATGLAVAFGPQIIVAVGALSLAIAGGLVNAIAAASAALVAFSLTNPFTALLLAITVAITAVYHFRDEINKALGVDVIQIAKDAANFIIGSFVAAWTDIKALWDAFPAMLGAAFVGAVNIAIDQINRLVSTFTGAMDTIISGLNALGADITPIGDKGQIKTIFNTYLIELELAIKERNKLVNDALSTDWIGKITRIFTPSQPTPTPALPNTATKPAASTQSDEMKKNYEEIVKGANNSVRALQSEQQALQMTGYAASVFREQQDLINAALAKGIELTPQQTANLKALGEQMAALKSQNAASTILQDQQASIGRLQLERQMITATTAEREKALAVYDAEQNMIRQGIDLNTQQAAAIRANAAAMAQLKLENERVTAAYSTIQQTGASAIDSLVQGATTVGNSWKDTFKNILTSFVQTFTQLAVANPLKNMLLGTNLPPISDLFAGKSTAAFTPGTTSTGTMSVTAGTVMVNGGMLPGVSTNGGLLGVLGATNGVRPTLTPSGIVNAPVAANSNNAATVTGALVNGVRPDLMGNGIVNAPVAANQNIPAGSIEQYIRTAAIQRGIDPDIAVKVANSEGGVQSWNLQSQYRNAAGIQEPSYGPFQLLKGGPGTGFPSGLGNDFMNKTGLDPALAANGPQGVDFALDYASKNGWGAWYGANKVGVSKWEGIGPRPASDQNAQALPNLEQANQSLAKLSTSSVKASTDVSSLSTGADTAAKALSTSSNSVTSSVSSLATTTAQIPQQTQGLFSTMMSSIGGGFSSMFSGIGSLFGGLFADGGVFKGGAVTAFASGGVVTGPTVFPMRNGMGMMGERGPEAIMPLKRGPDGKLGVAMANPGRQSMPANENRYVMETTIRVEGVGDKDLLAKIHDGVDHQMNQGFKRFSREELPGHVKKIQNDKWARG